MLWGGSAKGTGQLHCIKGDDGQCTVSARALEWVFQHDNDPKHTAQDNNGVAQEEAH